MNGKTGGNGGKVLLMVAPNGARLGKEDHPALPLTAEELAADARACLDAGAAAIHLHVRDGRGGHTLAAAPMRRALAAVKRATGGRMIIQMTSEAVGIYSAAEQMAAVRAVEPPAVSIALRELAPDDDERTLGRFGDFLAWLARAGISPQFILYSPADAARFNRLRAQGIIPQSRPLVLFVLGYHGARSGRAADMAPFVEALENGEAGVENGEAAEWMVCAFGPHLGEIAIETAALGGHLRVGFENGLDLPGGGPAPDNAAIVAAVRELLARNGHSLMDPAAAAALFARAAR